MLNLSVAPCKERKISQLRKKIAILEAAWKKTLHKSICFETVKLLANVKPLRGLGYSTLILPPIS